MKELMKRIKEVFDTKPYNIDQFIADNDPKDHKDVQRLEEQWLRYQNHSFFTRSY